MSRTAEFQILRPDGIFQEWIKHRGQHFWHVVTHQQTQNLFSVESNRSFMQARRKAAYWRKMRESQGATSQ